MKEQRFTVKGFLVWGVCALFFLYEFFIRTVVGTYQTTMMQDLNLTIFQFSLLSTTLFAVVYGAMQIPVGLIVNNIGLKKALGIGVLVCTVAAFGFSFSSSYWQAIFYRMLMGFGAAFGFICLLIAVDEWMPHSHSGIFIGLSQFIGTIAPILDAGPLDVLSQAIGVSWKSVFLFIGGIGAILLVAVILFVENNHQKAGRYIMLRKPEKISVSILRLFAKIQPWYIALLSGCLYFTVEYLTENEGHAFLVLKGVRLNSASYMITIAWIGYAMGCPLLGFLSDYFERRKTIMSIAALLGVVSIVSILYFPKIEILPFAFFSLGISASGQTIGFVTMTEQFKKQFVAVGFGLNNGMIAVVSAGGSALIGFLFDYIKRGGTPVLGEYVLVFNILIGLFVMAVILALFLVKETYCKSVADYTYLNPK